MPKSRGERGSCVRESCPPWLSSATAARIQGSRHWFEGTSIDSPRIKRSCIAFVNSHNIFEAWLSWSWFGYKSSKMPAGSQANTNLLTVWWRSVSSSRADKHKPQGMRVKLACRHCQQAIQSCAITLSLRRLIMKGIRALTFTKKDNKLKISRTSSRPPVMPRSLFTSSGGAVSPEKLGTGLVHGEGISLAQQETRSRDVHTSDRQVCRKAQAQRDSDIAVNFECPDKGWLRGSHSTLTKHFSHEGVVDDPKPGHSFSDTETGYHKTRVAMACSTPLLGT